MTVLLKQNCFKLWILVNPENEHQAWTGSRWDSISNLGLACGDAQVSNLNSREDAIEYAKQFGFSVQG